MHIGVRKTNCFTDKDDRKSDTAPLLQTRRVTSFVHTTQLKFLTALIKLDDVNVDTKLSLADCSLSRWVSWSLHNPMLLGSIRLLLLIHRQPHPHWQLQKVLLALLKSMIDSWWAGKVGRNDSRGAKSDELTAGGAQEGIKKNHLHQEMKTWRLREGRPWKKMI